MSFVLPRVKRAKSYLDPTDNLNRSRGAQLLLQCSCLREPPTGTPPRVFLYLLGSIALLGVGNLDCGSDLYQNRIDLGS